MLDQKRSANEKVFLFSSLKLFKGLFLHEKVKIQSKITE